MNQVELLTKFKEFNKPFYSFADLQLILGLGKLSANKRIIDLVKQGFLIKLARNVFVPSFWDYNIIKIGSYLNQPAYLSFESALGHFGILKEGKEFVTFATVLNFPDRMIGGKSMIWSKINRSIFFGFYKENDIMVAVPEKAFLDLIYMFSFGKGSINEDEFILDDKLSIVELKSMLNYFPKQTYSYLKNNFKKFKDL